MANRMRWLTIAVVLSNLFGITATAFAAEIEFHQHRTADRIAFPHHRRADAVDGAAPDVGGDPELGGERHYSRVSNRRTHIFARGSSEEK